VGCVNDWVPAALGRLDLDSLIGLSVAEARARVEEAGGKLRAVPRGRAMGLPYHPGLVTVLTDDDRVTSVLGLEGRIAEDYVPAALANMNLESLVGLSAAQARARVQDAGGELDVLTSWGAHFDIRPWRVTVQLATDHQVVKVLGRG